MTATFKQYHLALAGALGFALAGAASSASASLVYGTLSNFDVYNDTGGRTYGFEIEFDDVSSSDISYTFPSPHYGSGVKSQNGATATLRYAASFDSISSSWSAFTNQHPEGGPVATSGHACVFADGCEHFGLGLYATPSATRYHWLVEDAANPGNLITGPAVSLMAPIWAVIPPANGGNPPVVDVRIEAPEFEQEAENEKQYPDAVWVRITKLELDDALPLEALMSDNDDLFNNPDIIKEEEIEWDLVEKGGNPIEKGDKAGDNAKQIIRRIETYRYIGPVTAENEPDCDLIDCDNPILGETLGDLVGANIAAVNLDLVEANPVPVPAAAWLFGSALAGLGVIRRRVPRVTR